MITSQSYSHFVHNMGYHLTFSRNNTCFFIPTWYGFYKTSFSDSFSLQVCKEVSNILWSGVRTVSRGNWGVIANE